MMELVASKGLGDALYMRAVALHCLRRGHDVSVFTGWPDVFSDLPVHTKGLHQRTGDEDLRHAKPCLHCRIGVVAHLDVFSMLCLQAGIVEPVEFRLDWRIRNIELVKRVRREAAGRPVLIFQPLKRAANLNDALARPDREAYADFVASRPEYFRVKIGHPGSVQGSGHPPCDLDLVGKTSVHDAIDLGASCDAAFGESSFVVVMAEAMDKPFTCMFSSRAIRSGRRHIANLRPERTFHKRHLATAVFDEEVTCRS